MASKLNAFIASIPANASVRSPPENACFIECNQPQPSIVSHRISLVQRKHSASFEVSRDSSSSNEVQGETEDEILDVARPSPLKKFIAAQEAASKIKPHTWTKDASVSDLKRTESKTELDAKSEAGPMRMATVQGSQQRGMSTYTTSFNRYLRQQASCYIDQDTVQHFANVPIITASAVLNDELESEMSLDNNANEKHVMQLLNPAEIVATFRLGGMIPVSSALEIIRHATNIMSQEQNVIFIRAPYTLVGDLHGQFQDLLELFRVHGFPAVDNPFLFLGDYVDRGVSSCEIILLLLAYKIALPGSVYLLRGNHECRSLSTFYGFRVECLQKYGPVVYNRMIKCFESMPLAAELETIHGTFLALHGGLSPDIRLVEDINGHVNRFMEPERNGPLCDLLWSDPTKDESQEQEWAPNAMRGCSFTFNERACREFLRRNNLLAIIRAHELEENGYKEHFCLKVGQSEVQEDEELILPAVVTVFSAPEYCNTNANYGATLKIPWEKQNGCLLLYQQHKRCQTLEFEFTGPSEDMAVKAFLKECLPFFPIDFYELVSVCRKLRSTLEQATNKLSPATNASKTSSLVSSLFPSLMIFDPKIKEDTKISVSPCSTPIGKEVKDNATHACEAVILSYRMNSDRETESGESSDNKNFQRDLRQEGKCKTSLEKNKQKKQANRKMWDTNRIVSGWKICPGFVRMYDRYFARDRVRKCEQEIHSASIHSGRKTSWISNYKSRFKRSFSTGEAIAANRANDFIDTSSRVRRKSMTDWMPTPSFEQVAQFNNTFRSETSTSTHLFTQAQWQALKLYFSILDLNGNGVIVKESFAVLLAEQDSDAYATEDELSLIMEVMDCNADCMITEQDFLLYTSKAGDPLLKKSNQSRVVKSSDTREHFTFEHFQTGTATCGDVAHFTA
ncbi:hypothetical protein PsorP6_008548 [Peronosclerospora sorghi]|uniref:Uncharacterized protein n=1 Tax=Peronosclerospora sorghi TaxID=230839 RepID=A0ACC0WAA7_9STRA|nr:hypothetical protein PsorP6_008548 [Peronosclerospora sorghi]